MGCRREYAEGATSTAVLCGIFERKNMNTDTNNAKPLILLQQAFDALEATTDSDIEDFDDEEEEAEAVPAQYACRKIMEAMDLLRAANRGRLLGA